MTRARETSENARLAKAWVNFNGAFGTSPFTEANGASSVRFVLNRVDGLAIDREIVNVIIFGD